MNELMLDCLEADCITNLENGNITQEQFDNRVKKINEMRGKLNEK